MIIHKNLYFFAKSVTRKVFFSYSSQELLIKLSKQKWNFKVKGWKVVAERIIRMNDRHISAKERGEGKDNMVANFRSHI